MWAAAGAADQVGTHRLPSCKVQQFSKKASLEGPQSPGLPWRKPSWVGERAVGSARSPSSSVTAPVVQGADSHEVPRPGVLSHVLASALSVLCPCWCSTLPAFVLRGLHVWHEVGAAQMRGHCPLLKGSCVVWRTRTALRGRPCLVPDTAAVCRPCDHRKFLQPPLQPSLPAGACPLASVFLGSGPSSRALGGAAGLVPSRGLCSGLRGTRAPGEEDRRHEMGKPGVLGRRPHPESSLLSTARLKK